MCFDCFNLHLLHVGTQRYHRCAINLCAYKRRHWVFPDSCPGRNGGFEELGGLRGENVANERLMKTRRVWRSVSAGVR